MGFEQHHHWIRILAPLPAQPPRYLLNSNSIFGWNFLKPSMSIFFYRNVRYVLKMKNPNITQYNYEVRIKISNILKI